MKCLRFAGYASNLAQWIDMKELRLHGMKSHDRHIFIQNLILVAFREMVPEHVWSVLLEVSFLFQILCSTTLDIRMVEELEVRVFIKITKPSQSAGPSQTAQQLAVKGWVALVLG
ncbi:UNVERIFIED_CONTAM: hypothetical protein Sradi_2335200 [Sesamum radiatum]|uniref:Uncharacterized protein n=1 Tax=Sesamum radiatum TaxID=300843 RepID=A0AAW2T661_SESRA